MKTTLIRHQLIYTKSSLPYALKIIHKTSFPTAFVWSASPYAGNYRDTTLEKH